MSLRVLVLVGTKRGAFILQSDSHRREWSMRGPLANVGWSFCHLSYDPRNDFLYAAGSNAWFGSAVWRSPDLGATWDLSSEGITYGDDGPRVRQVWNVTPAHGAVYAGLDPAGLFRSADGARWAELPALRSDPSYAQWRGGSGGLCLHSIVPDPADPDQMWVATAGGGVMYTADGGRSWAPRNPTVRDESGAPQPGYRVQKLVMAPGNPAILYQQNHRGVFRTGDGGRTWTDITAGLPSPFGFCIAVHPHDPDTLWVIPLRNDGDGRYMPDRLMAVWRSSDRGESWVRLSAGLPGEQTFVKVLREGLATDSLDPAGVYFGTSGGHLFGSSDGGDTWTTLAAHLPAIQSVRAIVLDGKETVK